MKNGKRYTADPGDVVSLTKISGDVNVRLVFALKETQNASDIVDADGQVVEAVPEEALDSLVGVSWTAEGWRMYDIDDNTPYESRTASPEATP
ncbi:MAG: hypothetical protein ACRCXL_06725 [Dermatophilaceae bacterium]